MMHIDQAGAGDLARALSKAILDETFGTAPADWTAWSYWWAETCCALEWPDGGRIRQVRALEGSPVLTLLDLLACARATRR